MGSVRNPVGPLPSSIYWRRRVVVLCLLALAVALVAVGLNSGGHGGGKGAGAPTGSRTPVATITAGPAPSGSHISGYPGGRDTAPADGGSSAGGRGGGPADGSSPSAAPSTEPGASATASTASTDGTSTSGREVPVGSTLPDCAAGSVQLSLSSVKNSYSPGESPAFDLRAANTGDVTCKLDFGPAGAVFTITAAADGGHVWASDDCPASGSHLLQVPAHGTTTYRETWNGKTSSPKCATPKGAAAGPGTYLVSAQLAGYPAKQVSFVLAAD